MGKHYNSRPDNDSALKHGLENNVKRLTRGQPFVGPAAEAEALVRTRLETEGVDTIITTGAIRLEALATAFYHKACEALENNDFVEADKFVKRVGWLQMGALRAWQQVRDAQKNGDDSSIIDALSSIKGNNGNNSNSGK